MTVELTRSAIVELRERHAAGESALSLAHLFGLSRRKCDQVLRGALFPELPGPIAPPPTSRATIEHLTLVASAISEKRKRRVEVRLVSELLGIDRGVARKRIERMIERDLLEVTPIGIKVTADGRAAIKSYSKESESHE